MTADDAAATPAGGRPRPAEPLPAHTVVFVGPSLPDAARLVAADALRPPATRGDVMAAVRDGARLVLLIDGVMVHEYGPSPTEVWQAIDAGAIVVGAASVGALRAVELRRLGMVGLGWVYSAYLDGLTDGDDEVLALCEPDGWRPLTVPLIRVRFALQQLVARGLVVPAAAEACLRALRRLPVEERLAARVTEQAAAAGLKAEALGQLGDARFDVKARDSHAALAWVRARGGPW